MLPNFLYIGPDKSGSTWIYFALKEHPEVCLSKIKDVYFFDKYYKKGWSWYEKHFSHCIKKSNIKAIGELSHDYLFSKIALQRIKESMPNIRLITSLRNPIDRAFSDFLHLKKHALIKQNKSFLDFVKNDYENNNYGVIQRGFYNVYLDEYFKIFQKDNILVLLFDELINNPNSYISRIYKFIGVDSEFVPAVLNKKILAANKPRIESLAFFVKKSSDLLRHLNADTIVGYIKDLKIIQKLLYVPYYSDTKPIISQNEKEYLLEIYKPHILQLESLLNVSLNSWLNI